MQAYIIGLSINKDLKLRKRKGEDRQCRSKFYMTLRHVTAICGNLWQFAWQLACTVTGNLISTI
jgi:hypothetical protein